MSLIWISESSFSKVGEQRIFNLSLANNFYGGENSSGENLYGNILRRINNKNQGSEHSTKKKKGGRGRKKEEKSEKYSDKNSTFEPHTVHKFEIVYTIYYYSTDHR